MINVCYGDPMGPLGFWWCQMASFKMVNICAGNGLLPDGTKPPPEPTLIYFWWNYVASSRWQFHMNIAERTEFMKWVWKLHFEVTRTFLRGQWGNSSPPSATYMHQWTGSKLVQVMACRLFGAKSLPELMLTYCQLDPEEQTSVKFKSKYKTFHSRKCTWKCRLRNGGHLWDELTWGSFHYWESELTFGNLTNLWRLANQKVSHIVSQKVSSLLGLTFEG